MTTTYKGYVSKNTYSVHRFPAYLKSTFLNMRFACSSLSRTKAFRLFAEQKEVQNALIALFTAFFSYSPTDITKIKPREILSRQNREIKVFRYSFSDAIPIFFNRLKSGFFLVRSL